MNEANIPDLPLPARLWVTRHVPTSNRTLTTGAVLTVNGTKQMRLCDEVLIRGDGGDAVACGVVIDEPVTPKGKQAKPTVFVIKMFKAKPIVLGPERSSGSAVRRATDYELEGLRSTTSEQGASTRLIRATRFAAGEIQRKHANDSKTFESHLEILVAALLCEFGYGVARQCLMPGDWAPHMDGVDGVNPRPRLAGAGPRADVVAWRTVESLCEILVIETEWTKAAAHESVAQAYEYSQRLKRHGFLAKRKAASNRKCDQPDPPDLATIKRAQVTPLVVGSSWRNTETAKTLGIEVMGLPRFIRFLADRAPKSADTSTRRRRSAK